MAIEFTDEEKARILEGLSISAATAGALSEFQLLEVIAAEVDLDGLVNTILASVSGEVSPEVLAAARAQAERQARQITGNLARAELQKVAGRIEANLAAGKSPLDIVNQLIEIRDLDAPRAARLEAYKNSLLNAGADDVGDKVERMRLKLLRDRRETIARTEQRQATEEGMTEIAKARGAQYKISISAGDDRVSDICEANEAQGYIPINEAFSSGHDTPTYHPNCRCTLAFRTLEPDATDKGRAKERSAETAAAKAPTVDQ
jgi:hypothetical protein